MIHLQKSLLAPGLPHPSAPSSVPTVLPNGVPIFPSVLPPAPGDPRLVESKSCFKTFLEIDGVFYVICLNIN